MHCNDQSYETYEIYKKNELETLHRHWIKHIHISSLASFSLWNSEVLKISRRFRALLGWKWKRYFSKTFLFTLVFSSRTKSLKPKKHRLAFDSRWPCRESKFASRGWWVIMWNIRGITQFYKQRFYLSNLKTPRLGIQTSPCDWFFMHCALDWFCITW